MSILHTVNKPGQAMTLCLRAIKAGDSVLLLEDGVYELMNPDQRLTAVPDGCAVYVMAADALARGVPVTAELVDYERFVSLSVEHEQVLSWF